jgi:L-ascorbate metabolism protein UlaG (beta-lactamase superfamily)
VGAAITWLGHSTVLIEQDGVRLLTDPLLRRRVAHLRRDDEVPPPPGELDAVLISHVHHDHLDTLSLRKLGTETPVVAPRGAAKMLARRGFRDVTELLPGEEHSVGAVTIIATPAEHTARRLGVTPVIPTLGYELIGGQEILFAGDTDKFDGMAELVGDDVVLLPISGWGPKLPAGHLNPRTAAEALTVLQPRIAIPIHWGTYAPVNRGPAPTEPAGEFAAHAAELAPGVEIRILKPGETTET